MRHSVGTQRAALVRQSTTIICEDAAAKSHGPPHSGRLHLAPQMIQEPLFDPLPVMW